jgi:hypothetical protein
MVLLSQMVNYCPRSDPKLDDSSLSEDLLDYPDPIVFLSLEV